MSKPLVYFYYNKGLWVIDNPALSSVRTFEKYAQALDAWTTMCKESAKSNQTPANSGDLTKSSI